MKVSIVGIVVALYFMIVVTFLSSPNGLVESVRTMNDAAIWTRVAELIGSVICAFCIALIHQTRPTRATPQAILVGLLFALPACGIVAISRPSNLSVFVACAVIFVGTISMSIALFKISARNPSTSPR